MKLKKAKRFNTVESYASCICQWSACFCGCTCSCICDGPYQPTAGSSHNTFDYSSNNLNNDIWMNKTSSQGSQM